jgi:hypothetical protein
MFLAATGTGGAELCASRRGALQELRARRRASRIGIGTDTVSHRIH